MGIIGTSPLKSWISLPIVCVLMTSPTISPLRATAEDDAPDPQDIFIEAVHVSVVNIDVYVTDRDGEPVLGLGKDDFEIEIDGRAIAVSNFFAVQSGRPATAVARSSETAPPATMAGDDSVPDLLPDAHRLNLILYIDNSHLNQLSRNRSLRSLRDFLRKQLAPGDRVMIVTHEQELHVRLPFTSDREAVADALFRIEEISALGLEYEQERRDVLNSIYESESAGQYYGRVNALADSRMNDTRGTIRALKDHIQTLAGLPGRKAVIYVSDGFPMRPGEDLYHALHERLNDTGLIAEGLRNDISHEFQRVIDLANTHGVVFYPLESVGLRTYSFQGAESSSPSGGVRIDQVQWGNLRSTLLQIAEQTGGQAIINTNNQTEMLNRIGADLSNYYSLGFIPASTDQALLHEVKVRLRKARKGVDVRHRRTYREMDSDSKMGDTTMAALHFGYQSNPLGAELVVGTARLDSRSPKDEPSMDLDLLVAVPIRSLGLVPRESIHMGMIKLFFTAQDTEGRTSGVEPIDIPIEIPDDRMQEALEQVFTYELTVKVRPGPQMLALGIRDEIGGQASFLRQPVVVQATP